MPLFCEYRKLYYKNRKSSVQKEFDLLHFLTLFVCKCMNRVGIFASMKLIGKNLSSKVLDKIVRYLYYIVKYLTILLESL